MENDLDSFDVAAFVRENAAWRPGRQRWRPPDRPQQAWRTWRWRQARPVVKSDQLRCCAIRLVLSFLPSMCGSMVRPGCGDADTRGKWPAKWRRKKGREAQRAGRVEAEGGGRELAGDDRRASRLRREVRAGSTGVFAMLDPALMSASTKDEAGRFSDRGGSGGCPAASGC